MKHAIKGFFLWVLNNALLITFDNLATDLFQNPSDGAFLRFLLVLILWFITGCMIVTAFVDAAKVHIKKNAGKKELLTYSFTDNSILLSTETIQKNGFYEIYRQANKEHSVQILCFNNETGEFQAFDRFHWMDEPYVVNRNHDTNLLGQGWLPNGTYYKEDLWTPIKLHFTAEWIKEHLNLQG